MKHHWLTAVVNPNSLPSVLLVFWGFFLDFCTVMEYFTAYFVIFFVLFLPSEADDKDAPNGRRQGFFRLLTNNGTVESSSVNKILKNHWLKDGEADPWQHPWFQSLWSKDPTSRISVHHQTPQHLLSQRSAHLVVETVWIYKVKWN